MAISKKTGTAAALANILGGAKDAELRLEGPVWLAWRAAGRLLEAAWHSHADLGTALAAARADERTSRADTLEICLTADWTEISGPAVTAALANGMRGRIGLEICLGSQIHRIAPTTTIATNRALAREVERIAESWGVPQDRLLREARFRRFAAQQFLVPLHGPARPIPLSRGGQVVPADAVDRNMLDETVAGLRSWMLNNVAPDGRMTYKYWPSAGGEAQSDNTIRQFMATVALGRMAMGDAAAADAARRNLAHNLAEYYVEVDGVGTIILDGKAKLGAMAIAALAILEFRLTGLIEADAYEREFDGLCRGIMRLWQPDGAFRTFLVPRDRNDNQNFYPGETQLFWATLHRHNRDAALAQKCLASFRYYRNWHIVQPNPAFVPWHVQAYVLLHEDLGIAELADFVLQRSDWLLSMQQWGGSIATDLWGRFYDPARPHYGPPHASATGVYMEGLIEAWRLARRLGDTARADRYALSLRRGVRAVRQLQFRSREIDAFYIARPEAVMGGLRTEVYNNEIRVDNVQHCLMAMLKMQQEPDFPWTGTA